MPTPRLCVVGSTNTDLIVRTPRFPRPGETLAAHNFHTCHGGKGANQAVTAATLEAFRLARAAGVRTILNPAPAAPLPDELLRLTDLCIPNETELELLTGTAAASETELVASAHALQRRGPPTVLVTLGEKGSL